MTFTGYLGDGINRTYSTGIVYSSLGGMAKEQFGTDTPVYNKSFYNSRGQLSEIRVSTSYTGPTDTTWNRGAIINHYSNQCWGACNGTDNNGNLKKQEVYIPLNDQLPTTSWTSWWQGYDYDNLNRLQRVKEYNSGGGQLWQQEYVYDRWGNRTIHQTNSWGTGINKKDFTVNTANNRLGVAGGQTGVMSYDAAGNLTNDTYTGAGSRVYDAENRMTKAWGGNNQWQEYTYDGNGQRVRRKVDGVETWQVYGMGGELLAEYPASGSASSPRKEYGYRNGQLLLTATPPITAGTGLQAQYFDNMNFTDLKLTRTDATVNFDWAGGAPDPSLGVDTFTVRWQGKVEPQYSQNYTFYTLTDDGVRLWVNGQLLINKWVDQGPTEWSGSIALTAGQRYDIVMEFYENGGGATAKLSWSSASQPKQIIPQSRLYLPGSSSQMALEFLVTDQLGTPRMVFDKTGSLATTRRHDYLPFGEELYATQGVRTSGLGYSGDAIRQKFTSYERDNETGLDYAQARYYSNTPGRFTSPDPLMASGKATDPQSWNRYAYVGNNPLAFIDPSGLVKTAGMCPGCGGIQQGSRLGGEDEWFLGTDIGGEIIMTSGNMASSSSQPAQQQQSGASAPTGTAADPQQDPVTVENATPDQQRRFNDGYNELSKRLHANDGKNSCAELFGGVKNAEKTLKDRTKFSFGPVKGGFGAETEGKKVVIDPNGFFMAASKSVTLQVGFNLRDKEGSFITLSNVEAAAFVLAHELGHRMGKLSPDGNDPFGFLTVRNNGQVHKACFSDAPIFLKSLPGGLR